MFWRIRRKRNQNVLNLLSLIDKYIFTEVLTIGNFGIDVIVNDFSDLGVDVEIFRVESEYVFGYSQQCSCCLSSTTLTMESFGTIIQNFVHDENIDALIVVKSWK